MNGSVNYSTKVLFDSRFNTGTFSHKLNDFFPGLIFALDLHSQRIYYVNKQVTSLLGFPQNQIMGTTDFSLFVHHDDVDMVKHYIREIRNLEDTDHIAFACRLRTMSGGYRNFNFSIRVLQRNDIGLPKEILFIGHDVTEQLKAARENEAMTELFRETEDLLQFGSWSWDLKSDQLEWTEGMYYLIGYTKEEMPTLSGSFFLQHVATEDRDRLSEVLDDAIKSGSGFEQEYMVKTKSGVEKTVFTKGRLIADANGVAKKMVGITRDVTSLKNLESERERTIRELNRSNKELEEFAYVASHDMQEPLRKISTFNERLKAKFGEVLGQDGNAYLDRIISSTDNMRMLIDNLLEFSRISRSSRAFVSCDLNAIIREAISDQELKIEETGCVIHINNLPAIEAVTTEMKQLFTNLISNAIKFRRKEAPPVIEISGDKLSKIERNRLHLPSERGYQKIEFRDNGIGFEQEYAERIFQIFQRLHGKTEYAGSGIGLAICKKIVDNHEGMIFAHSKPGLGSTFVVILPEKQAV